jgi:hypothetical protein
MRNLYRAPPRPGKGKVHPAKRGGVGWAAKKRNDEADDGSGWVYLLTGMGGRSCDQVVMGQTRNHPAIRAMQIQSRNKVAHWSDSRLIDERHRSDPPQLWACQCPDRRTAAAAIHRLLVEDYFAREEAGDTSQPSLATILRVMEQVTGELPLRFSLIGT